MRDIAQNEEVTLDYGSQWAAAWDEHTENWNRAEKTPTTAQVEEERDAVFHPHAFRHKVLLSDEIYPESWRNLKKDGKAGASDEL